MTKKILNLLGHRQGRIPIIRDLGIFRSMAATIDYTSWDKLAAAEEAAETERKNQERDARRMQHFREQALKQKEYEARQRREAPDQSADGHGHSHDHTHDHAAPVAVGASAGPQFSRPRCGCGFMDPEEIKRLRSVCACACANACV
jgi:hypothetical protein